MYATAHIARTLKAAREDKGLSQRALGKLAGVPQSHISKIENGAVDLRLSSLVELARVLDLELVLVPRKSLSAVQSIVRGTRPEIRPAAPSVAKELKRLCKTLNLIRHEHPGSKELGQIQRQVRELQHLQFAVRDSDVLREVNKTLQAFKGSTADLDAIRGSLTQLQGLRNSIVHALPRAETVKPAYSLEEDDYG
jgi:transcriptional regulator with XRE-family HTH domain